METMPHESKQVPTRVGKQGDDNKCPSCDSSAIYKYGKVRTGKQRYLCIVCGRQFTDGSKKATVKGKPVCPECGRLMNLYKIDGDVVRFRCSGYPECRTFKKYRMKEE
ncbi:MAG TPA: Insertion element protein [Nitrospiraceae bacterium]|jgi:transposase-like protein|nr:Insertion element protein [Nitrospiraceae bacterium]